MNYPRSMVNFDNGKFWNLSTLSFVALVPLLLTSGNSKISLTLKLDGLVAAQVVFTSTSLWNKRNRQKSPG